MNDPIVIPVTFIAQLPGLCGAACAQMLLYARGVVGVNTSNNVQAELWAEIKTRSNGGPVPKGQRCTQCGYFVNQVTEWYEGCYQCWCSHPRALTATLNARLGTTATFAISRGTQEDVTATAVDAIDRGSVSVMLVYGTRHWVVVHGYTPDPAGMVLGTHSVSHIHIQNPQYSAPDGTRDAVAVVDWMADYMATAEFGEYNGDCVVITEV